MDHHVLSSRASRDPVFSDHFQNFRTHDVGRAKIIEQNFFVDAILPMGVVRGLTEEDIINYRRPSLKPKDREPAWIFPNEIPIEGRPEDVWGKAEEYTSWLLASYVPKLFFWVKPGSFVTEEDFVRLIGAMENAKPIFLGLGRHFVQEIIPTLLDKKL